MNIDRKYTIHAVNPCSGNTHDEYDSILFLAKDKAVPAMLRAYFKESEKLGANPAHLESIGLLIGRVEQYQHEVEAKIPDTDLPCEIRRCVDGEGVSGNKQDFAPGAQPVPSFADAYQGAMEEAAIWKKRALEAEDLNRKFITEINGPTHMGEPAQPTPSVPDGWKLIPEKHPTFDLVDLKLADGSVLCGCIPQSAGDYWWEGPSGEVFIDPKYAPATHWRLAATPEAKS
jgi:hypothetical protein